MVWKKWKTLAALRVACKERHLDTSGCNIKREYCQLLNDYDAAQESTAAAQPTQPIKTPPSQHARHDSKKTPVNKPPPSKPYHRNDAYGLQPLKPPSTPRAPATHQDLLTARQNLLLLHQKVPLILDQAQKVLLTPFRVAPEGKVIPRISALRSGILTFNVENIDDEAEAAAGHIAEQTKAIRSQITWLEFELKQLVDVIVARQKRSLRDEELMMMMRRRRRKGEGSSGMLEAMLDSVRELVAVRNCVLERAYALQFVEVEDGGDWPLESEFEGGYEQRLGELEWEMEWLEGDIDKWERAIGEFEELMG